MWFYNFREALFSILFNKILSKNPDVILGFDMVEERVITTSIGPQQGLNEKDRSASGMLMNAMIILAEVGEHVAAGIPQS